MFRLSFILLFFSSFTLAEENVLIISDIDDTVKMTNQLDLDEALKNSLKTDNHFFGMNELYQALVEEQGADNVVLKFVTNARYFLSGKLHKKFIKKGNFPESQIFFWSGPDHKVKTIERLLEEYKDHAVILVGDNGEKDIDYYHEIVSRHPKREFFTFIRLAYSPKEHRVPRVRQGQTGFVTPAEIALELAWFDLLMPERIESLFEKILSTINGSVKMEGSNVFPNWINCGTFEWNPNWDHMLYNEQSKMLPKTIEKACRK